MDRRRGYLRVSEHQAQELERWEFPDYSQQDNAPRETALNYDPHWLPAEEEPEQEQGPDPLTAAELDDIRQSAYEEGFAEGKASGHAEGFEAGKTEGLEAGMTEGREQGHAEGLEAGQQVITEHVSHLTQLIEKLAAPLQQVNTEVESQLVSLVTNLTRELIRVEVQTNPQVLFSTLREAIAALPIAGRSTTILLNPEDVTLVEEAYGEENLAERNWKLMAEPALSRGDIQIQSGDSTVEYLMEERIRQLLQQFSGVNNQPGAS